MAFRTRGKERLIAVVLSARVKAARVHSGLSLEDLAYLMGITARCISYWESGERLPGLDDLCRLAVFCDVSLAHFMVPLDEKREAIAREVA